MSRQKEFSNDIVTTARTAIIVLGMHRSGTSAFARVASLLGCELPKNLMPADQGNDLGHWESNSVTSLNERLLASAGSKWDDWTPLNQGWEKSAVSPAFLAEAEEVLLDDYGKAPLFVLKDPRICRLAPFWLKAIKAVGARAVISFPLRNPYEVSGSLSTRDGSDEGFGLLLWLRHVLEAEAATRNLPRYFFAYEDFLVDWGAIIDGFENTTDMHFPRRSVAVDTEITAFLSQDARHQRETSATALNAATPIWVRDTYAILSNWCAKGEDRADLARLDAIRAEFDASAPSFARLIALGVQTHGGYGAGAQARAELAKACEEVERLRAETIGMAQVHIALDEARGQIEKLQRDEVEVQQLRTELENAHAETQRLKKDAIQTADMHVTLEQAQSDIKRLQSEADNAAQVHIALDEARSEIEKLRRDEVEVQQLRTELENARNETQRLQKDAIQTADMHVTLEQAQSDIKRLQSEADNAAQVQIALDEARREIEKLHRDEVEVQQLHVELGNARIAIEQMQSVVAQARNEIERLQSETSQAKQTHARIAQDLNDMNEANRRMEAEIAKLKSALRQREEEAAQAWAKAETEQRLREKAEAEQARLIRQNEELIAQFAAINERVRSDASALASARRRAGDAESAMGQISRQHEKLLVDLENRNGELSHARSRSARADAELAQLAMLHMHAQDRVRDLEEIASHVNAYRSRVQELEGVESQADVYRARIRELEEITARMGAYQIEMATLSRRAQAAEEEGKQVLVLLDKHEAEARAAQAALAKEQVQAAAITRQAKWLQDATAILQKKPRFHNLFSSRARQQYSRNRLKAAGLFDAEAYLEKNPDVAEAGEDPLLHYVRHGLLEGRPW